MESFKQLDIWVKQCQRGDRKAFEAIFRLYQPRLRYYVRRLDHSSANADDLLQDIWMKVIKKIGTLKDVRAFTAWLYRIARNEVMSMARIKDPFVGLSDEYLDLYAQVDEPVFDDEDATRVHQALNKLKTHQREILTLSFLEQMPYKQIAELLGIKVGTVRSRVFYAKQSLCKELENSYE
ncbi:MAG: sigma-70 family RNA polymerase sigma factor [Planctomycetes bacterium]|nr:sigma-70 family RNA polymerase sigma factor [Planctomycetota bacterium]